MENEKIIIPNGTIYNIKYIIFKESEETLNITTTENETITYNLNNINSVIAHDNLNNINSVIAHDNIYILDFLENDDLDFKYDIKPDDLKINSIIFEDRDSYLNFLNNFIKHVNTTRRNNSKEDIVIY